MTTTYKRILVAIDGSNPADNAFWKGVQLAKEHQAQLSLVYVVDTSHYPGIHIYDIHFSEKMREHGDELLNQYIEKAKEQGIENVHKLVLEGSPKSMIPKEAAKDVQADLIVCGATGLNAVERILLGSVSENIVRHATCDVLVVRHSHTPA